MLTHFVKTCLSRILSPSPQEGQGKRERLKPLAGVELLLFMSLSLQAQTVAFPGAEGFGALTTGGRDSRKVVHVTNLNASGPGSFAEAVNGSDRIVVFDVGGVINLSTSDMVAIDKHNNITVLGQTAPGDGITVYGNRVLIRNCSNVIFRYIRMRGSINMAKDAETLTMDNAENVILDHCSISWGRWDNVHIKDANNITWQYCIISEGIAPQRFGAITDGTRNWTISHCLWIDNHSRNPKMKCYAQMINSVVYNGGNGVVGGHSSADNYQDLINNYFIAGPSGSSKYSQWTETDHLYQSGNMMDSNTDGVLNGALYTNESCTNMTYPHFSPTIPVTVETPEQAFESIVEQVGCSRVRDSHDARLIAQLKSLGKQGAIINSEEDVGGIGTLNGGTAEKDTDGDGIPDEWETANGLNPNNASDATTLADDGYLWIEKYANSLAATTSYLLPPSTVKVGYLGGDKTTAALSWTNVEDRATGILLEMSNDGQNYTQIDSLSPKAAFKSIPNLDTEKVYYFRLRTTDGERYSNYTEPVSINEPEGTLAGGGTAAGTTTFSPRDGKLYRIICYTSRYYNSAANYGGAAQYLTADNHVVKAVTDFDWEDPKLLWTIAPGATDSTVTLQAYGTKEYLQTAVNSDGYACTAADAAELQINYATDETAAQSGTKDALSFYRINAPGNHNWQLRGRTAAQWLWAGGTITRADMVFTFQAIDASLIGLYVKNLQARIDEGNNLLKGAEAGSGTLQYPEDARDMLVAAIENAEGYLTNYKVMGATQADIDSVENVLSTGIAAFKKLQRLTWGEYDASKVYVIYSYGKSNRAGDSKASSSFVRRYLADYGDGLVFRNGLTDANEANDTLMTAENARWIITRDAADTTCFSARNAVTGRYINIANSGISDDAVTFYPVYNNTDNGHYAFTLYTSPSNNHSLSIGAADSDALGGKLEGFTGTADRCRLRWIFLPAGDNTATGIDAIHNSQFIIKNGDAATQDADAPAYNLSGQRVSPSYKGIVVKGGKKYINK